MSQPQQRKNGHTNGYHKAGRKLFGGYTFYNFIKKDPIIDKTRTLVQDEGFYEKKERKRLALLTGLSPTTLDNMFDGQTRMPRHTTIGAIVAALGYKEVFVKDRDSNINRERAIAKAAKLMAERREELRKRAAREAARSSR